MPIPSAKRRGEKAKGETRCSRQTTNIVSRYDRRLQTKKHRLAQPRKRTRSNEGKDSYEFRGKLETLRAAGALMPSQNNRRNSRPRRSLLSLPYTQCALGLSVRRARVACARPGAFQFLPALFPPPPRPPLSRALVMDMRGESRTRRAYVAPRPC